MPEQNSHGVMTHDNDARRPDYLYRISIKCLVRNENDEVLVVKENGRDWWDLPGGGMDHGESIRSAIAREMNEEVTLEGEFTYRVIAVEDPGKLERTNIWQMRIIFEIKPDRMVFEPGDDGDEVAFMNAEIFKDAQSSAEQVIYDYALLP